MRQSHIHWLICYLGLLSWYNSRIEMLQKSKRNHRNLKYLLPLHLCTTKTFTVYVFFLKLWKKKLQIPDCILTSLLDSPNIFLSLIRIPWWLSGKESTCSTGDTKLIPGLGRSLGEGNGNLLQYSCLENSMDRGAWWLQSMGSQELDMTKRLEHQLPLISM